MRRPRQLRQDVAAPTGSGASAGASWVAGRVDPTSSAHSEPPRSDWRAGLSQDEYSRSVVDVRRDSLSEHAEGSSSPRDRDDVGLRDELDTPCDDVVQPQRVRTPLSTERIVDAALAYIEAHSLEDLSMRRLGGELCVEAMSLYRYFPSKAALLDAVVCRMLSELTLPTPGDGSEWEQHARVFARSFRSMARRHPQLFPQLALTGTTNRDIYGVSVRMIRMWREAGLDDEHAARAQYALQGFLVGSGLWEVATPESSEPSAQVRAIGRVGTMPSSPCTGDPDADFEFGLDVLVEGLRLTITPSDRRPSQPHADRRDFSSRRP